MGKVCSGTGGLKKEDQQLRLAPSASQIIPTRKSWTLQENSPLPGTLGQVIYPSVVHCSWSNRAGAEPPGGLVKCGVPLEFSFLHSHIWESQVQVLALPLRRMICLDSGPLFHDVQKEDNTHLVGLLWGWKAVYIGALSRAWTEQCWKNVCWKNKWMMHELLREHSTHGIYQPVIAALAHRDKLSNCKST